MANPSISDMFQWQKCVFAGVAHPYFMNKLSNASESILFPGITVSVVRLLLV